MDNTALVSAFLLLFFSTVVFGAQFVQDIKQRARMRLVAFLHQHRHMSQKEIRATLSWLRANQLLLDQKDFFAAKAIFSARSDLLDKSRVLHASLKDQE